MSKFNYPHSRFRILLFIFPVFFYSCKKDQSVIVKDLTVYTAGFEFDGSSDRAVYWKNDSIIQLSSLNSSAYDMAVSSSQIYVVGYEGLNKRYPVLWTNGSKTILSDNPGVATSIYVSGSDVYICGWEVNPVNLVAFLWKNGVKTQFSSTGPSSASSVFVSGNDIYVCGSSNGNIAVWKNGNLLPMLANQAFPSSSNSLFVVNSNFYCIGDDFVNNTRNQYLWTNGVNRNLLSSDPSTTMNSIYCFGSDIYISGQDRNGGCYWKNGSRVQLGTSLSKAGNAYDICVNGNDVFVCGIESLNNSPNKPVYWKNGISVQLKSTKNYAYPQSIYVY
jgi:hypothetical protein